MWVSRGALNAAISGEVPREPDSPHGKPLQGKEKRLDKRAEVQPGPEVVEKVVPKIRHWLEQAHGRPADVGVAGLEALDLLNLGVAVTDSSRKLLLTNRTAKQMLATRDGLEVSPQGVLTSLKGCCSPSLAAMIQQVARGRTPDDPAPKDAVLALQRPSGKRPITLLIRSVDGRSSQAESNPTILIFMLDSELPLSAPEAGLRQLFGLTFSEARLAHLLMSGNTLEDCCAQLVIRPSTARMHLGNLFAKTGVQRQGQLVSLLIKSMGMVRETAGEHRPKLVGSNPRDTRAKDPRHSSRAPDTLAAGLQALDLINIGVGVTNGLRQLLFANHTAQQILATKDGLEVTAGGILSTLNKACTTSLGALIQQAAQGALVEGSTNGDTVLAIRRPSGKRPLTLLVRSLNRKSTQPHPTGPAVLIFILDPELPAAATESGLRQLYGFTSTEARLAQLLMEGNALEVCCIQLEIRPSTARMHLGNLFAKTGVQRQSQLISLLLKSVGMIRAQVDENSLKLVSSAYCLPELLPPQSLQAR